MNLLKKAILGGFSSLMLVAAANAAYIDFGSSTFNGANGYSSFTVSNYNNSGIGLELNVLQPNYAELSHSSDGIGINSEDNKWYTNSDKAEDEIGGNSSVQEILNINFLTGPVNLSHIDLTNLFIEGFFRSEIGIYSINNGVEEEFVADPDEWILLSNGDKTLNKPYNNVSRITFKSSLEDLNSEFTLKGIEVEMTPVTEPEPVPEPGMISLLGAGILALSGINFFRRKK